MPCTLRHVTVVHCMRRRKRCPQPCSRVTSRQPLLVALTRVYQGGVALEAEAHVWRGLEMGRAGRIAWASLRVVGACGGEEEDGGRGGGGGL